MDGLTKNVILQGVVGSKAYGLDHANSDFDILGVFVEPSQNFWGLSPVVQTDVHTNPDITLHEVGKFISLALKCNPTVLELLWLPNYITRSMWGEWLVWARYLFLSESYVRNAFGGYAVQQARRLERRNAEGKQGFDSDLQARTPKHARHCFRLLRQGAELLATGDMTLKVPNREELFELGQLPVPQIVERFEKEYEKFQQISSVLPGEPRKVLIEHQLRRLRRYYFYEGVRDGFGSFDASELGHLLSDDGAIGGDAGRLS